MARRGGTKKLLGGYMNPNSAPLYYVDRQYPGVYNPSGGRKSRRRFRGGCAYKGPLEVGDYNKVYSSSLTGGRRGRKTQRRRYRRMPA